MPADQLRAGGAVGLHHLDPDIPMLCGYLLVSAFDAAIAARLDQTVRALARVVAEGTRYDDRIDYSADEAARLTGWFGGVRTGTIYSAPAMRV